MDMPLPKRQNEKGIVKMDNLTFFPVHNIYTVSYTHLHSEANSGFNVLKSLMPATTLAPAVSYTHLDVYKRQGLNHLIQWIIIQICLKHFQNLFKGQHFPQDVYKRQGHEGCRFPCHG